MRTLYDICNLFEVCNCILPSHFTFLCHQGRSQIAKEISRKSSKYAETFPNIPAFECSQRSDVCHRIDLYPFKRALCEKGEIRTGDVRRSFKSILLMCSTLSDQVEEFFCFLKKLLFFILRSMGVWLWMVGGQQLHHMNLHLYVIKFRHVISKNIQVNMRKYWFL